MCKLQWKPVFNIEAVKTCMKWGAYMCGEHVRKRVKIVRTCFKAPTCSCFVSLSKSNMSQPAQRDFWWKKTAGDCWWSNVYHHEMKPVPNQLGPVKSLFQKGTSNYGSQVPKVGLRRWSISPTDQEKTLKFIAMIRKCSWAKRWANFIYQKWTSFSRCFKLYHSYFTKIFASGVWFKTSNLTP